MATGSSGAGQLSKRDIIIAVDDSDASERACEWAIDNLYREGDVLHLFHVIPVPQPRLVGSSGSMILVDGFSYVDPDPKEDAEHVHVAKEFIGRRFVPKAESRHIPYKIDIVRYGVDTTSIGEVLCKRAEDIKAAAVVLASHNKGAVKEFFLGSVAKHVTHHCTQPVLVMR